jgi:ribonuclease Z
VLGFFAHTSPGDLGLPAVEAEVKQLVVTHIGHVGSSNPVLERAAAKHHAAPVALQAP